MLVRKECHNDLPRNGATDKKVVIQIGNNPPLTARITGSKHNGPLTANLKRKKQF
jgi:hypothetical protein